MSYFVFVVQLLMCPILRDLTNYSTVLHYLSAFAQIYVHRVTDAI